MRKILPFLFVLAACSSDKTTSPADPGHVGGAYVLLSANGKALPFTSGIVSGVTVTFVTDTMLVDTTVHSFHEIGYYMSGTYPALSTGHSYGSAQASGGSFVFRENLPDTATFSGKQTRDTLTIQRHDTTFKYIRH